MNDTTQHELDTLAQRIAAILSERSETPTEVYHFHHAGASMFCLGRFGASPILRATSPTELFAQGAGFLEGLRYQ
ncbi:MULTISPECIES: hypothetical protein [Stenotrophomonas]|uniref:hypothetical protein n=1 Tax=Stenotrophomonas TaxID=40323 RepID=UPI0007EF1010|nr:MULTISPECIES: hypothetical protein [Stenotrophomonas]MDI9250318.1 hypothetical protein [Stenotrophomonas sp. RS-48]OBU48380.1 hypothetical protein A9K76_16185 [Stenotrophomonas maltophilia]